MARPGCCAGLVRSMTMASPLVSHLGDSQSCISVMERHRAQIEGDLSFSFPLVAAVVVPEAGDGRWCQARRCFAIFSVLSCQSLCDLYFDLYDMNETCIIKREKKREDIHVL